METPQLRQLLQNAEKRGVADLAARCEEILSERRPEAKRPEAKRSAPASSGRRRASDFVSEFHFVCENDRGVRADGERFFWSGSWVVPESDVIKGIEEGARLALHRTRNEPSYRQGKIIDYRLTEGETAKKRNAGIEFLVAADDAALAWFGEGTGEQGFRWASEALNNKQAER